MQLTIRQDRQNSCTCRPLDAGQQLKLVLPESPPQRARTAIYASAGLSQREQCHAAGAPARRANRIVKRWRAVVWCPRDQRGNSVMNHNGLQTRSQLPAVISSPRHPPQIRPPSRRRTGPLAFALTTGAIVTLWTANGDTPNVPKNIPPASIPKYPATVSADGCSTSPSAPNLEAARRLSVNQSFASRRQINFMEINALFARGIALEAIGDLAGARLVLSRAAEAGDGRSAFMLAETYDPLELEKLGEHGLASSLATARLWYAKAHDLGWKEAATRLERLSKDIPATDATRY